MRYFVIFLLLLFSIKLVGNVSYNIIPYPVSIKYGKGVFNFERKIAIDYPVKLKNEGKILLSYLSELLINVDNEDENSKNIFLRLDSEIFPNFPGAYKLKIEKNRINIVGNDAAGVFYGIQSLIQIIRNSKSIGFIPCGEIEDYPVLKWRAFMLDEARFFKGTKVVKNLLDRMAELKMNVFHWHLTDHQGWRIEIKKYPKLTSVGAFRDSSSIGGWGSNVYDGKPHGGFYTQDEIREIVSYASERHITIVPEIDMPGHSSAAIAAYPELGSISEPIKVPCRFGPHFNVYDVTKVEVVNILRNILKEVIDLFPSKVIHIGGDEVRFNHWNESKSIQNYMKEHGIQSPIDLQLRFSNEMSNWLASQGCRMMGWNDITGDILHEYHTQEVKSAETTLSKNSLIHFWKGDPKLITQVIKKGYEIINSYHTYTYLDYSYETLPLDRVYKFNPIPEGLSKEEKNHVLGLGCQMWSEWIPTVEDMNRQIFPRIAAIAEVGWTINTNKNYIRFKESLSYFIEYWKTKGISLEIY